MLSLMTNCSIFITLPNSNNLLQISGKPLSDERVKVPAFNSASLTSKTKSVPSYINRSRILYGKPVCSNNYKIIGLPFKRKNYIIALFIFIQTIYIHFFRFFEFKGLAIEFRLVLQNVWFYK